MDTPPPEEVAKLRAQLDALGLTTVRYQHEIKADFGNPKHHWQAVEVGRWIDDQAEKQHREIVDLAVKSNTIAQEAKTWARRGTWAAVGGTVVALVALAHALGVFD